MEIAQLRLAMVFKVSRVEIKPIDGQKPGTSGLRKQRLVQQQLTQYPTSEELSIGKIKFKAFDLGGYQIARRVWKDYYAKAFDILLRKLQKYVPFGASVADLYAGAGVIGLSLAATRKCSKQEPLSWMVGSDVIVVDPPRKGLDTSLVDVLQNIKSVKHKAKSSSESPHEVKDEKRPWILRAREDSVQIGSKTTSVDSQALPETLIYISCGWESFKEDCKLLLSSKAWHLEKAHGYNFFPGTQSIEVLAVFKRGQGGLKKKKLGKKKKKRL